jgi:hypothetical protein
VHKHPSSPLQCTNIHPRPYSAQTSILAATVHKHPSSPLQCTNIHPRRYSAQTWILPLIVRTSANKYITSFLKLLHASSTVSSLRFKASESSCNVDICRSHAFVSTAVCVCVCVCVCARARVRACVRACLCA